MSLSLRSRIRRIVIITGIFFYLLASLIIAALHIREKKRDYASAMITTVKTCEAIIIDYISQYDEYIQHVIAETPDDEESAVINHFQQNLRFLNRQDLYYILDQHNRLIYIQDPYEPFQGLDLSHLEHIAGKKAMPKVYQSLFSQRPVVAFLYPISGNRLLVLEKDLKGIIPLAKHFNQGEIFKGGYLFILSANGTVVYHPDSHLADSRHNFGFELTDWSDSDARGLQTFIYNNKKYLCYKAGLEKPVGWMLYFVVPSATLFRAIIFHVVQMFLIFAAVFSFLIFFLQLIINKKLSEPVSEIVSSISTRNLNGTDEPIPQSKASGTIELTNIIDAINNMTDELDRSNAILKASEQKHRILVETMTDGVFILDTDGKIVFLNPEFEHVTGYGAQEFIGRPFTEILAPEHIESTLDRFKRGLSGDTIPVYEVELKHKDGKTVPVELKVTSMFDDNGEIIGRIGVARDVSERKHSEKVIRENERFLRSVFDGIQDGINVLDRDMNIVKVNAWMEKTYADQMPLVGKKCYEVYQKKQSPCPWCPSLPAIETGEVYSEIAPYSFAVDPKVWFDISAYPLKNANGSVIGIIEHIKDVSDRKRAQDALRRSELELNIRNRIAHVFLTVPDDEMYAKVLDVVLEAMESKFGIFGYIDEQGSLVCPSMTREIWDQCQVPDKDIQFPPDQWGGLWGRAMVDKKSLYSNQSLNVPQGHIPIARALDVPIIHQDELIGNFLVGNKKTDYDENDKRLLESICDYIAPVLNARLQRDREVKKGQRLKSQLQHAQRMEALGTLGGGVAHDFNNLLMGIQGRTSLMLMGRDASHPDFEHLQGIEEYVKSAADLTKQLLGFSRGGKYEVRPTDINELIKKTTKMFGRTKKEIKIHRKYQKDVWTTEVDQGQIEQVLMNLYVNAWQAMPGGGDLYVQTENVSFDKNYEKLVEIDPGKYVKISVTDSGIGMDEEVKQRIFDPFFTTKEMGRGTGLGLASAYGIIKNHDGSLVSG
ncbi:MAG: PAS domain S-box protein [Thermodesulfobacteriota bacterium]|nr:PAS domain S-box protein [Thermodesulfobacteriota bacterium]